MPTPKLGKGLGRKPDKPDARDLIIVHGGLYGYRDTLHVASKVNAPLPTRCDVFHGLKLPVYDQGALGSCTANAGVLYRRFLAQRFSKYSAGDQNLSRLFLYYQERKLQWNNAVNDDSGAAIRDIFYVLAHTGVCPEDIDPYNPAYFASAVVNDSQKDLEGAQIFRIGAYHRVPDAMTARSVLASGYAIALGFTVYESFEDIGADGLMRMPRKGEAILGGHAVVIRGYDDEKSEFLVQNSWGVGWGDKGCFRMPYKFLEDEDLSQFDMWMGHLGRPWNLN